MYLQVYHYNGDIPIDTRPMTRYTDLMDLIKTDTDACLIGTYKLNKHGYGQIWHGGKPKNGGTYKLAHRVVMSHVLNRPLTSDEFVCHRCDNPSCVNRR